MITAVSAAPSNCAEEKPLRTQLSHSNEAVLNTSGGFGSTTSPTRCSVGELMMLTSLTDSSDIMVLLFAQKLSIEWEQFKSTVAYHLRAKEDDVEMLSALLGSEKGYVNACDFGKLLRWFSPLVPEVDNNSPKLASSGWWRISSIAKLVCQPWFHGFALYSNQKLRCCPSGTFLIRFGSQAPHFILALKDKSTESVVEWRVLSMGGQVRLMEGERFYDLHQLVQNYSVTVPVGASCLLESPYCISK